MIIFQHNNALTGFRIYNAAIVGGRIQFYPGNIVAADLHRLTARLTAAGKQAVSGFRVNLIVGETHVPHNVRFPFRAASDVANGENHIAVIQHFALLMRMKFVAVNQNPVGFRAPNGNGLVVTTFFYPVILNRNIGNTSVLRSGFGISADPDVPSGPVVRDAAGVA